MTNNSPTQNPIIIYSTTWCGYCRMAKQYFESKGVDFVEKDIEADEAARNELLEKIHGDFRGVPVIDVKGTIVLGFDRPRIDAALAA